MIFPIHGYINRINNRLVFKRKARYKLELQTPETMKLFGSTKKLIAKIKKWIININKSQKYYTILHQITLYIEHVEPSNLVFQKTYNTEFDEIIITFTDHIW